MTPLPFCFVLHIHQPVGNFDHVFREHADDVYRPFLDFLERREVWPIGLHVSGPLIEWLEANDAGLLDRIGRLVDEGRIELLAAGWYEPVLVSIPRPDRRTQISWMRDALRTRFGVDATGLWLTERVWQPTLVPDLADTGIEYALVDDRLAYRGGATRHQVEGPIRVEHDGRGLNVLSIDEGLRYLIPFQPAEIVEASLRERHESGARLALFGDDGEKFGGWPRTREWLYDQGWLEAFGDSLDRLRSDGVLELVTPGWVNTTLPAAGPIDLPPGSYPEMDEWSDGDWTHFLERYSESGSMARRMRALSELCRTRGDPENARRAVARGQCNDAYWHGVFGGVYMKHLRQGVRRELGEAERLLRQGESLEVDRISIDDVPRWWVHSDRFAAWVEGADGIRITDLTHFGRDPDLTDVLTRRIEAYHHEALARETEIQVAATGSAPSIHDTEELVTLDRLPPADSTDRSLVLDRVLKGDLDLEAYSEGTFDAIWIWPGMTVEEPTEVDGALEWRCRSEDEHEVHKTLRMNARGDVKLERQWNPESFPTSAVFAPEFSLGWEASLVCDPETEMWSYPIITVSKCPDGFEEIEQGTSVTPRWPIECGRARVELLAGPSTNEPHPLERRIRNP